MESISRLWNQPINHETGAQTLVCRSTNKLWVSWCNFCNCCSWLIAASWMLEWPTQIDTLERVVCVSKLTCAHFAPSSALVTLPTSRLVWCSLKVKLNDSFINQITATSKQKRMEQQLVCQSIRFDLCVWLAIQSNNNSKAVWVSSVQVCELEFQLP